MDRGMPLPRPRRPDPTRHGGRSQTPRHRRPGPRLPPPRRRRQDLLPRRLPGRQGPRRPLHLQPLPHRPGLRRARSNSFVADYKDKGVPLVAISPNDPLAVRLDELGYTDLGDSFEDMKIRARTTTSTSPTSTTARPRRPPSPTASSPPPTSSSSTPTASSATRAGSTTPRSRSRHLARRHQRHRRPPGRQARPRRDDPRLRLLHQVVRQAADARRIPREVERTSPSPSRRSTSTASRSSSPTTPNKLLLVNLWATWCGPCVAELPDLVEINRMYRGRHFEIVTISLDDPDKTGRGAQAVLAENHVSSTTTSTSRRPRRLRRGPRQGMARARPLHPPDRPRRQGHLPPLRLPRSPGSQAGHRRARRPHLLIVLQNIHIKSLEITT